jgi:hypothetical protein
MTEDQLQALFWKTVWNKYPQLNDHMWAVPNGANRNKIEANRMKSIGLLAGVWDIHIFWKNKFYIIETKLPGENLTVTYLDKFGKKHRGQKEWGEKMAAHGAIRYIYHSIEEGIDFIENIINETI